jgi:PTH1 family peptidyl-tRNA hydrolase
MFIFIGLGNPGTNYQNNRHNVGQMLIDYLAKNLKSQNENIKFFKTDCFMNQSGKAVKKIIENCLSLEARKAKGDKLKIENLIILHDDLDIPLGKFKIQKGIGPKLHNGIKSIEQELKTKDFWRVRIGVDNRKPENHISGEVYVLQDFLPEEKELLTNEVFPAIKEKINRIFLSNQSY